MKNVVAALIITMVLGVSYADTPVNRDDVVMGLLERLVCDIEDNFDETNEEQDVDWVSWTQEGFFGEMSTNQTEQILYRKAFDAVLENFATNGCQSLSACDSPIPQQEVARVALCQVRDMSYTNAVPALRKWALNSSAPHRDEALSLYFAWERLSPEMMAVANSVLTNASTLARSERVETVMGLTARINDYIGRAGKDGCYTSAVQSLYQTRRINIDCATGLDVFFVAQFPGYEQSSNRLETVRGWLGSTNCTSEVRAHCISVTNQLMNAAQPLLEVEALRGL